MPESRNWLWLAGTALVALAFACWGAIQPIPVVLCVALVASAALVGRTYTQFVKGKSVPSATWVPELLVFPVVLSMRNINGLVALIAMGAILATMALRKTLPGVKYDRRALIVVLVLAVAMVVLRPTNVNSGIFSVLALVFVLLAFKRAPLHSAVTSLMDGVGVYLIANVGAYYLLGMRSAGATLRTGGLETADGGTRVLYPLSTSLNLPPILAAAFLAASLLLMERGVRRVLRISAIAAACVILVTADSRTALVGAAIIAALTLFAPKVIRSAALPVTVAAIPFAFIFPSIGKSVVGPGLAALTAVVPTLSRNSIGSSDASLNGRETIWGQSIHFWLDRASDWAQFFGYGSQGQYVSGASRTYAHIFGTSLQNPYMTSVHNSFLQQLFDGGIAGLACLIAVVIVAVYGWKKLSRDNEPYTSAALAMSVSLVVSSVTEVTLAPGMSQETVWLFLGLAVASCVKTPDGQLEALREGRPAGRVGSEIEAKTGG